MTDFEIEKTMITGMVKSLFKGVRVVSDGCDDDSFRIMIPKRPPSIVLSAMFLDVFANTRNLSRWLLTTSWPLILSWLMMGPIFHLALLLQSAVNQGRRPPGRHFQVYEYEI